MKLSIPNNDDFDGELIRRWQELRKKWGPYWMPTIVVDGMIYDYLRESREAYPEWKECVEDMSDDALLNYIKKLWGWIVRWR